MKIHWIIHIIFTIIFHVKSCGARLLIGAINGESPGLLTFD